MSIRNLAKGLIFPSELFYRIKENPQWVSVFLFISIFSIVVSFSAIPYSNYLVKTTLSSNLDDTNSTQTVETIQKVKYLGLLFIPFMRIFKWAIFGTAIYYAAILINSKEIKYKQIIAVLAYSETILLMMAIVNTALLYTKEITTITNTMDINTIVGLDVFLSNKYESKSLYTFLNNFNVFTIWYLISVSIGIGIMSNLSKLKSSMIVFGIWFTGLLFQVAIVALTSQMIKNMGI